MGAKGKPVLVREGGGEGVEIPGNGVGGVRRDPESTAPLPRALEETDRTCQRLCGMQAAADIHDLEKPPDPDRRLGKKRDYLRQRLDVEDRGASPVAQFRKPRRDRIQIITMVQGTAHRIESLDPSREAASSEKSPPHHRVIEMTMGVDQTGKEDDIPQILPERTGMLLLQILPRSDGEDVTSPHGHPGILDCRRHHR